VGQLRVIAHKCRSGALVSANLAHRYPPSMVDRYVTRLSRGWPWLALIAAAVVAIWVLQWLGLAVWLSWMIGVAAIVLCIVAAPEPVRARLANALRR
jgi:hypothetical protein